MTSIPQLVLSEMTDRDTRITDKKDISIHLMLKHMLAHLVIRSKWDKEGSSVQRKIG